MTTAELLITIEEAVTSSFPDRAAVMLAVVRRWLWFSVAVDPPPDEDAEAAVVASKDWLRCMWCSRGGAFSLTTVATPGKRANVMRWWVARWATTWRGLRPADGAPVAVLCGACAVFGADVAEATLPSPDVVLADLARALARGEDGARASQEIGRRSGGFHPPARDPKRHCEACRAHSPEGAVGRDALFLCTSCLQLARIAALEGARVRGNEEPAEGGDEPW